MTLMNLGMPEMIFIVLLALVVVGPKKLPEVARQLGKLYADFKRASNDFKLQLETEMMNIELEERAKKQQEEGGQVLAAEKPWEPMILPPERLVSRGADGPLIETEGEPNPPMMPLAPRIEETEAQARPASTDA